MTLPKAVANAFRMTDEVWRRHANPWSVVTRFAAIPAMALAIWSRVWIGWWALVPVALVILWLWLNPRVFRPVSVPTSWAAKGIFGEKLWLTQPASVPDSFRRVFRGLIALGATGFVAWGLVFLQDWPIVFGITVVTVAQLWRIDRMGILYEQLARAGSARDVEAERDATLIQETDRGRSSPRRASAAALPAVAEHRWCSRSAILASTTR